MKENFRGIKKVVMINVLEGNGKDIPFREVHYIFDLEQHGGTYGGYVGKIDNLDQIASSASASAKLSTNSPLID